MRQHLDRPVVQPRHDTDFSVIIPFLGRRIVFDEHHLRPRLQRQRRIGRIKVFRKRSFQRRLVSTGRAGQRGHFRLVDPMRRMVMRCQRNVSVLFVRIESGPVTAVQLFEHRRIDAAFAHGIQHRNEAFVALPVNMLQFDADVRRLFQCPGFEKERRRIESTEQAPLLVAHDRSQLLQVSNQQQLHAAERFARIAVPPEHVADRIEHVGADHADLVDHQQVDAANNGYFLFIETELLLSVLRVHAADGFGNIRCERQLEKRMDRHPAGIDRCHTGRRHDDHPFRRAFPQPVQERSLTRPRPSGQKQIDGGLPDKTVGQFQLRILHRSPIGHSPYLTVHYILSP